MSLAVLSFVGTVNAFGVALGWLLCRGAPEGFEDAAGFHRAPASSTVQATPAGFRSAAQFAAVRAA